MICACDSQGQTAATGDKTHSPMRSEASRASSKARGPEIVDIGVSAFPYDGTVPETDGTPFLQKDAGGNLFHIAPRGGKLLADKTYADPRSLLFIPRAFDPRAPAALVLFLHGNLATLSRDVVRRQHVPEQVEASKANVILVAPQLAVDALDSSAGRFWKQGFLDDYLRKAAEGLAALSDGRVGADEIDALPVIIVAYSGGYLSTAFSLQYALAQSRSRIAGVVLLDALFGEEPKFADWVIATHAQSFFVSAYSRSSSELNAKLEREVTAQGITFLRALPSRIVRGDVIFQPALGAVHNDFVTQAFGSNPLQSVLSRIDLARIGRGSSSEGETAPRPEREPASSEGPADSACPADAPDCQVAPPPGK